MIEYDSLCKYSEISQKIEHYPIYKEGVKWIKHFIAKPHNQLGRFGPVCPFVPLSIKKDVMTFGVIRTKKNDLVEAFEKLHPVAKFFCNLEPTIGPNRSIKSLVLFFPDLDPDNSNNFIDDGHKLLKPYYITHGLMIGEFHKLSNVPGYHNNAFKPMISPVSSFVIRYLSTHDIRFLNNASDPAKLRMYFLVNYLVLLRDVLDQKQVNEAHLLLDQLKNEIG
jgi:hypothetical protein